MSKSDGFPSFFMCQIYVIVHFIYCNRSRNELFHVDAILTQKSVTAVTKCYLKK